MYVSSWSVFCDLLEARPDEKHAAGCTRWIAETTEGKMAARRIAVDAGWRIRDGFFLHPACIPVYEGKPCPHAWKVQAYMHDGVIEECTWCLETRKFDSIEEHQKSRTTRTRRRK